MAALGSGDLGLGSLGDALAGIVPHYRRIVANLAQRVSVAVLPARLTTATLDPVESSVVCVSPTSGAALAVRNTTVTIHPRAETELIPDSAATATLEP